MSQAGQSRSDWHGGPQVPMSPLPGSTMQTSGAGHGPAPLEHVGCMPPSGGAPLSGGGGPPSPGPPVSKGALLSVGALLSPLSTGVVPSLLPVSRAVESLPPPSMGVVPSFPPLSTGGCPESPVVPPPSLDCPPHAASANPSKPASTTRFIVPS